MKKILEVLSVKFQILVVKFSICFNRRVFVMQYGATHCKKMQINFISFGIIGSNVVYLKMEFC